MSARADSQPHTDALVQLGEVLAEELYTLVVEAMDMHAASKPVQLAGCLALLRLGREAFVDETASAVVLVALNGHAYDTAVVELAACTLTVVLDARVESCRQRGEALVALGGLTIMARAIDALRSQGDALVRLLAAVRQLLLVCPAAARKLPVSFVESVRESWASNPTNERVLVTVLDLLVLAYHEHAMWPSSGRAPLVAWAVHVLRCYARRDDVQARCLWLLSALCVDDGACALDATRGRALVLTPPRRAETRASVKAQRRTIHAAVAASVAASPDAASAWRYLRVYAVQGSRPPVATAPSASPASVARTGATAALSAGGAAASAAAAAGTRRSQMSRVVVLTPDEQAARDTPAPAAAAAVAAVSARALADLDSKLQAIELRSSPRRTTPLPVGNAAAEGRAARGASHSFAIVSSNAPGLPSATLVTQGVMPGGALALRASAAASPTPPDTNPGTLLAQRSALGPALAAAPPSLPASAAAPADRLAAAAPLSATAADDLRAPSASGVIARPRDALYGTMASPARRAALHGPWRASTDADDDADALEDELRARLRADASDGTEAYVQSMLRATSTAHVRDTLDTLFPSLRPVVRAGAGAGVAPS